MESPKNVLVEKNNGDEKYDLNFLLSSPKRDFLIYNNAEQVKVNSLMGNTVGLYFSGSWCGSCQDFTPELVKAYNELKQLIGKFEIVLVTDDDTNESFDDYFSKMPWLAIPFSDKEITCKRLCELFSVDGLPHLEILGENGKVLTDEGRNIIQEHGAKGIANLIEQEEAKRNQLLKSLLVNYVITADGEKVKVDSLLGSIVGLYFSSSGCGYCQVFTPKLVKAYNELIKQFENFEIVFVSHDEDFDSFDAYFSKMPWLAVPFSDSETRQRLNELINSEGKIPNLVILDENGKVSTYKGRDIIEEHGAEGYPFNPEHIAKLKQVNQEAKRNQSLKSLLVSPSRNYVITSDEKMVAVEELEGKTVGLYFALLKDDECLAFNQVLGKVYESLKEDGKNFEIVMIPLDDDGEVLFKKEFEKMPWLSLPLNDNYCEKLARYFEVDENYPFLVVIGPNGKTVHWDGVEAIEKHGKKAFPFTAERLKELEAENETLV